MKIMIDVGNSRIKWMRDDTFKINIADSFDTLDKQWQALANKNLLDKVIGANVRDRELGVVIDKIAVKLFQQKVAWQVSSDRAFGVVNAYAKPATLGVDRWAAMIAARARSLDSPCVVVDAGTAITVDMLDAKGNHLGGAILPGMSGLFSALNKGAQLRPEDVSIKNNTHNVFASNTEDAILSGVFFAASGGVMALIKEQARRINVKIALIPVYLTGGDALMLNINSLGTQHIPNLVLEGLQIMGAKQS